MSTVGNPCTSISGEISDTKARDFDPDNLYRQAERLVRIKHSIDHAVDAEAGGVIPAEHYLAALANLDLAIRHLNLAGAHAARENAERRR